MNQVRDNIQRMAILSSALRLDTHGALLTMLDACNGKTTLHHLSLYQTKREIDSALENLAQIKSHVDAACEAAEASVKGEAA